jgi:type II secretory pathway component PulK
MRRSGNIINSNQAYLYALGAETLAIIGLNQDAKDNKIDSYEDIWAMEYDPFPIEDGAGYIYVKVADLQSRFNVNNLIKNGKQDALSTERFQRLLTLYGIDPEVSNAVIDWIDTDVDAQGLHGAEDDYYLGLESPYRTANRPLTSVSELRQVRGLDTAERFNELAQHLVALPEYTPINVNLAGYEIHYAIIGDALQAAQAVRHSRFMLEQEMEPADGQQDGIQQSPSGNGQNNIIQRPVIQPSAQSIVPYNDITDYTAQNDPQKAHKIPVDGLSADSQYFLVVGEAELDRGRANIKSVLHRDKDGRIRVLLRTLGDL